MMQIYDMHIHTFPNGADCHDLIRRMEEAGVSGGTVFSGFTPFQGRPGWLPIQDRLDQILEFCAPYPDRLFPVLFVDPHEDGIIDMINEAAERGIRGFKCTCSYYFVYEDASMKMLEAIAKTGKPISYHTGILWDSKVSGQYGRPLNWEHLIEIPGLRFSLAHCSWPWYDECIGVYSKFLSLANDPNFSTEMFLDMTPGTPPSFRRDLITKLVKSGFDVFHNMMWGTDCNTGKYASAWAKKWIDIDGGILRDNGVSEEDISRYFCGNMQRFFHISDEEYRYKPVKSDGT